MNTFIGMINGPIIQGAIFLFMMAGIISFFMMHFYGRNTALQFKNFANTGDITKLSGNLFLNQLVRQYGNCIKVNKKGINTQAMIEKYYYTSYIGNFSVVLLEKIVEQIATIILLLGIVSSMINFGRYGMEAGPHMWTSISPAIQGSFMTLLFMILRVLFHVQEEKKVLFKTIEEYLDNDYYFRIQRHKEKEEKQNVEKIEKEFRTQMEGMQQQIQNTEEEIHRSIMKINLIFDELEMILNKSYKLGEAEAAATTEEKNNNIDIHLIEEFIGQVTMENQ